MPSHGYWPTASGYRVFRFVAYLPSSATVEVLAADQHAGTSFFGLRVGGVLTPAAAMISNNSPAPYVISGAGPAGGSWPNSQWQPFSHVNGDEWYFTGTPGSTGYLQIDFGTGAQINPTQFGWVDDTDGNNPTRITLLASNTGAFAGEQVTLADITTPGFTSSGNLKLFAA